MARGAEESVGVSDGLVLTSLQGVCGAVGLSARGMYLLPPSSNDFFQTTVVLPAFSR